MDPRALLALVALGILPAVVLGACLWFLLARPRARTFEGRLAQSVGLIAVAGLIATLAQLVAAVLERIVSDVSLAFLAGLPLAWWILCGGWSVQQIFEETAEDVTGHRRDTFMDNAHYYLALTALQTLLVAALLAWRWRGTLAREAAARWVFALVLANSLAGIRWPWWGT